MLVVVVGPPTVLVLVVTIVVDGLAAVVDGLAVVGAVVVLRSEVGRGSAQ